MIRRILFTASCLAVAGSVFAQTEYEPEVTETVEYSPDKYKVETNRFWDNWFISAGVGGQVYFGDHDKQASFGDRIAPALDIAVGKWFTSDIGVRLMYSGLQIKGATQKGSDDYYWLEKQKFDYFNFHVDALFNLTNLIEGYKENRFYNISAYGGLGVMHTSDAPSATDFSGHFGLLNSFRLSPAFDLNIDLRGTFVDDSFDGEVGGRSSEGMLTATIGLTYKFKRRGWDRSKTVTRTVHNNGELNILRDRIDQMGEENAYLRDALAQRSKEKETIVREVVAPTFITFRIGRSDLSNDARVSLGMFAEVVKQGDPNVVYTIIGYADAATGSEEINDRLSKARAEAVYDCLVNEFGVDKSQLTLDHKGGVENMFYDDPRMSRVVIMFGEYE